MAYLASRYENGGQTYEPSTMRMTFVEGQESATSRALCLPEIIAEILSGVWAMFRDNRDYTIFACALVNSLWEVEANRHIWFLVGLAKHTKPGIRDLMKIDADRQQKYADYISALEINTECSKEPWEGPYDSQFMRLAFPRLEQLNMAGPEGYVPPGQTITDLWSVVNRFLGPRLKRLCIKGYRKSTREIFSDDFFHEIRIRSKGLNSLSIDSRGGLIPYSEIFALAIQEMSSLTELSLDPDFHLDLRYSDLFKSIAAHQGLKHLHIKTVYTPWASELTHAASSSTLFSNLSSFKSSISADALELLLPHLGGVQELELEGAEGSERVLYIISQAKLPRLVALYFNPPTSSTVAALDILNIARSFKTLTELNIQTEMRPLWGIQNDPKCPDMDDEVLRHVIKHLPNLEQISLVLVSPTVLTHRSLWSLARYCRNLRACKLMAAVSYSSLLQDTETNTTTLSQWPNLEGLVILPPLGALPHKWTPESANRTARLLLERCPSLEIAWLSGENLLDSAVDRALRSGRIIARSEREFWAELGSVKNLLNRLTQSRLYYDARAWLFHEAASS